MIQSKIADILQEIGNKVKLIAVSKNNPSAKIVEAYEAGQRIFGENRVQELCGKYEELPKDIEWHLIGHLQKNKVKYIAPFVAWIHSVDSIELLETIQKEAAKNNRTIQVLLQLKVAQEESKFGMTLQEAEALILHTQSNSMPNVLISGIMGMSTHTQNQEIINSEFKTLKNHFDFLKNTCFKNQAEFAEVSMGMSNDYALAIQNGSSMVRIGSLIFGERI